MKKTSKTLLSLLFISSLFSCGSTSSSLPPEIVTGIEIAGPISVEVGKTIPLICDVIGSEADEVTWESSNTSIATVNEDGVVTGINEGSVTISATSVLDTSFVATYEINVTLPKITEIKLVVKTSEDIVKNPQTGVYDVPLGKQFIIDYETVPALAREPDSINYEVVFPSGSEYSNAFTVEIQPDNSAIVYPYGEISGVAIKATATYNDFATVTMISSAYFNVYDKNINNKTAVLNKINEFEKVETSSLIFSKVSKTLEKTVNNTTTTTTENVEHKSFTNASYTTKTITEGSSSSITNLYLGVHNNSYYAYEYDNNSNITKLYENCEETAQNSALSSLYCDVIGGSITYGHTGVLSAFFNLESTLTDNIVTFGSALCYAYSKYTLNDNQYIITSQFEDYLTSDIYDVKLTINFDDSSRVTSYIFEETIIKNIVQENNEKVTQTTKYKEVASDFVYGTKTSDSSFNNRVDMDKYYYTSFDIVDLSGTKKEDYVNGELVTIYDYTSDKYGPLMVQTDNATGLKKYSTTYDRSLVFGLGNIAPITATTKIDSITSSSSNPDQVPNIDITSSGIITINAKKDDNGLSMPGSSTFTFTSKNGISQSIIVEFYTVELKDLLVTNIDSSNSLGTIFQNELSDYFYLNTKPDEARYSFDVEILEGPSNGIELYQHAKDNLDGLPGFSFSILGKTVGTYKFKFYVEQNPTINSEAVYTINVIKPFSTQELKEKLISSGSSFSYNTGTMEFKLSFTNETTITFEESAYGSSITQTISYHFEEGAIVIEDEQKMTAANSYFYRVKAGKAPFEIDDITKDITSVTLYLQTTAQSEDESIAIHYTPYTFDYVINLSTLDKYLNGKTLTSSIFISGQGTFGVALTFNNNHATILLKTESGSIYATIDFDFTYDSTYYSFYASNFNSTKSNITGVHSFDYLTSYSKLRLTLKVSGDREVIDFTI